MAEKMNNLTGKEWLQESFSIWSDIKKNKEEISTKHPALFPQKLPEKLIRLYTKCDGETILDPFMGIGSTLLASMNTGTKSIGFDLNKDYCKIAKKRIKNFQKDLFNENKTYTPEVYNLDSNKILTKVKEESVDLAITSPPYWDILNQKRTADFKEIRNYSDSKKDIGNISDYEKFLESLKSIFTQVYKSLKFNKRCISVVMDIRKKDKFYPLHEDQTRIMKEIGFELEEYVIWNRQSDYNNMKTLGYPWVFRFNKVHEFICIYWKR
tara:strand:+ start:537 stop:1337 length:801 start_codon:yes stop_codon:yes gene_type:complete